MTIELVTRPKVTLVVLVGYASMLRLDSNWF